MKHGKSVLHKNRISWTPNMPDVRPDQDPGQNAASRGIKGAGTEFIGRQQHVQRAARKGCKHTAAYAACVYGVVVHDNVAHVQNWPILLQGYALPGFCSLAKMTQISTISELICNITRRSSTVSGTRIWIYMHGDGLEGTSSTQPEKRPRNAWKTAKNTMKG